jgi:hypothetical protein
MVLTFYQSTQTLDQMVRGDLVTCIVEEFYAKSHAMGVHVFRCLAKKITDLFPGEEAKTYIVVPDRRMRPTKKVTGRLADKYYNFYRKITLMLRKQNKGVKK